MTTPTQHPQSGPTPCVPTFGERVERDGQAAARLTAIADLIEPCPVPDGFNGYNLCAHAEPWSCPVTLAAWLACGLHPAVELAAELATAHETAHAAGDIRHRAVGLQAEVWLDDPDDGTDWDASADAYVWEAGR